MGCLGERVGNLKTSRLSSGRSAGQLPGSSQMRLSTQLEEGVGRGEGQASR